MTAYRQQALDCALAPDAGTILLRNVYGWFAPVSRGVYRLTEAGEAALLRWPPLANQPG